jgi:hypothetical protein
MIPLQVMQNQVKALHLIMNLDKDVLSAISNTESYLSPRNNPFKDTSRLFRYDYFSSFITTRSYASNEQTFTYPFPPTWPKRHLSLLTHTHEGELTAGSGD